jgi:hypothetical protein
MDVEPDPEHVAYARNETRSCGTTALWSGVLSIKDVRAEAH